MSDEMWDEWNKSGGPKYPHEKVVQFCFRNYSSENRKTTRALDLGCGSGVHCVFLAREGFITTGVDSSTVAIHNTEQRLLENRLSAHLKTMSIECLNFPENSFDLVISISVFDSAGLDATRRSVAQVSRILSKNGLGFFLFARDSDYRVQGENLLKLYGFSRLEVENIFTENQFSEIWFDTYTTTYQNQKFMQCDWLITVKA